MAKKEKVSSNLSVLVVAEETNMTHQISLILKIIGVLLLVFFIVNGFMVGFDIISLMGIIFSLHTII